MKRLGPDLKDLKLSKLKLSRKRGEIGVPQPLRDLYQDLRDRRLLPLLALILVAIVAVPFLLSDRAGEDPPTAQSPAAPPEGAEAEQASLRVVEAQPGLRDYRKRLRARSANDPFAQRFTKPITKGGDLQSESSTTGGSTSSSSTTDGSESSGGAVAPDLTPPAEPPSGGGSNPSGEPQLQYYTFTIDVQISRSEIQPDGSTKMGEPEVRKGVRPPKPLPATKVPVVTYLGITAKGGAPKALLMVSDDVNAVFGDAKCISGTDSCELLEVEPGMPELFEYGPNDVRYKFKVIRIDPVVAGHS